MLLLLLTAAGAASAQSEKEDSPGSGEPQSEPAPNDAPPDFAFTPQATDGARDAEAPAPDSSDEASRSILDIGLHASGGFDTNPAGILGSNSQLSSIAHILGSLSLRKIRPRSETAVDYSGGGSFWDGTETNGHYDQQQFDARERIRWSRGQLLLGDSLRYLGEGDLARVSVTEFGATDPTADSGDQISEISRQAYLSHISSAFLTEGLTERSSARVGVSYSFINYLGNGESAFNSRQGSISAAFNSRLSPRNMVGIQYRWQNLEFPNGNAGHLFANSVLFTFQRTISGRMDLVAGAGPQLVTTGGGSGPGNSQINASAQASLLYLWNRSGASVTYNRVVNAGADVYAGANENIISASIYRDLSRSWRATAQAGYTQASGINLVSAVNLGSSYSYEFLSATVTHRLGPALSGFASYQINNEKFANCFSLTNCNDRTRRHSVLIGFDWSIRTIPLD